MLGWLFVWNISDNGPYVDQYDHQILPLQIDIYEKTMKSIVHKSVLIRPCVNDQRREKKREVLRFSKAESELFDYLL